MGNTLEGEVTPGVFEEHYRLAELIGKGSQGRVHTCVCRTTGEMYAVKVIDRKTKTAWSAFRREVDLVQEVGPHKNLLQTREHFVDSGQCYVIMTLYNGHLRKGLKFISDQAMSVVHGPGGSTDLVQNGPRISNITLRHVVSSILSGVHHLHQGGWMHRDIKAQNILIDRVDLNDPDSLIVLSDYGLAKRMEPDGHFTGQVGTRKYWPPEMYERKYRYNMDVFAIGIIMFLATTGKYPYNDEKSCRRRDIFSDGSLPNTLCSEARDFMRQCLEKDPGKRPNAKDLVNHPWFRKKRSVSGSLDELLSTSVDDDQMETYDTGTSQSPQQQPAVLATVAEVLTHRSARGGSGAPSARVVVPTCAFSHKLAEVRAVKIPVPRGDDDYDVSPEDDAPYWWTPQLAARYETAEAHLRAYRERRLRRAADEEQDWALQFEPL